MTLVDTLAFFGGHSIAADRSMKFEWPIITDNTTKAILRQLRETISIYDNSSIFGQFEEAFANYHNKQYALLSNSGTSSILAMFDSIDLNPGDEILCPVYTFHATISPAMNFGCTPVFCDCDEFGNICFNDIQRKIGVKTKAVIVTHMWGEPVADIGKIAKFCKEKGIKLLEDCSHAHGARFKGQLVGTFGDVAAWSLQGQKIISGGEGGILLTNDINIFEKALIHGHYNKRSKNEIRKNSYLYKYYLTGKGNKYRAHPIAIAIAMEQFENLDKFLKQKKLFASKFDAVIDEYPFLVRPQHSDTESSFYSYGFHFLSEKANGLTKTQFLELLHAEGLIEFDDPGSTGLVNELPIFLTPNELFPNLYSAPLTRQEGFLNATRFTTTFMKVPIWVNKDHENIMDLYVKGFRKVSQVVHKTPKLRDLMQVSL